MQRCMQEHISIGIRRNSRPDINDMLEAVHCIVPKKGILGVSLVWVGVEMPGFDHSLRC